MAQGPPLLVFFVGAQLITRLQCNNQESIRDLKIAPTKPIEPPTIRSVGNTPNNF